LIFAKACGFQTNTLTLFFFLKEKEAKRIKNPCRIYRLYQCRLKPKMARLSPLVMFAHTSQTFGGTARRRNASQARYGLQTRVKRKEL
jgi:hypothetical protein